MHPSMAVWIWSMAMSRAMFAVPSNFGELNPAVSTTPVVRLGDYLQSEIIALPLPNNLLDRLADLYWTERESELPI